MNLNIDFTFTQKEHDELYDQLVGCSIDPYVQYDDFVEQVANVLKKGHLPERFMRFAEHKKQQCLYENPYVHMANCPVDRHLPELSFENPVLDKRRLKRTYVAEAFLSLYALIFEQTAIGYINVNDGDVFQDIYPKADMSKSQSQKALYDINFHKDLANHFVRPTWVNILGLQAEENNEVYTGFTRNKDVLEQLSPKSLEALHQKQFHTPYDDLTITSNNFELGEADIHQVLGRTDIKGDICFFENRTRGLNEMAQKAVEELIEILHCNKRRVHVLRGSFISCSNDHCLHNKEIVTASAPEKLKQRWLMKTVNIRDLAQYQHYMLPESRNIVNG
ncbi:hypothetical protein [Alteromonas stellipolaris]|uniref:hypothetical protein n=1 Tax=Alteromonas stellipolaris TaxID=233316 RepID=UPI001D3D2BB3|nr:hypothetical protein [Alteromonas stellipolaris]MBZ2163254.1 hypothetical protein [Alteromonas stellipolaris]